MDATQSRVLAGAPSRTAWLRSCLLSLLSLTLLALAGCSDADLRKGPSPVLDATSVEAAASNQISIINALARDAGYDPGGPVDYYRVAEAGFNYVDDQCQAYFDEMYFIERGRSQAKSGLAAAGATTAAILGLTNASTMSLAIVASAFGFASNATDIVTGTYLYALPPAATQGLVNQLQAAYRDEALKFRAQINAPTAAYHHIHEYLSLCLPPRIEAEVIRTISAAGAKATTGGSGSTFSVQSAGVPSPAPPPAVRVVKIRSPTKPLPNPEPRTPTNTIGLTETERFLLPRAIQDWQVALCVTDQGKPVRDGALGSIHSPTRDAIRQYLITQGARGASDKSDTAFEIGRREADILNNTLVPDQTKCTE